MNICRQCQKQFDDNVLFCPSCGNKLEKQNVQVANNIICQKCGNTLTPMLILYFVLPASTYYYLLM